jgi:hypothetical protein
VPLDHRPHGAVEHEDAAREKVVQVSGGHTSHASPVSSFP